MDWYLVHIDFARSSSQMVDTRTRSSPNCVPSMPYNVKHDPVLDIIEVTLTGLITETDLREATTQAISIQKQRGTTRFLVDANGRDVQAPLIDIYEIPNAQYRNEELNIRSRIAVILSASVSVQEAARFYETVCFNRGWNAKICADRQSATDWLLGRPSTRD